MTLERSRGEKTTIGLGAPISDERKMDPSGRVRGGGNSRDDLAPRFRHTFGHTLTTSAAFDFVLALPATQSQRPLRDRENINQLSIGACFRSELALPLPGALPLPSALLAPGALLLPGERGGRAAPLPPPPPPLRPRGRPWGGSRRAARR